MHYFFSKLFGKTLGFMPVDPLADGLAEEIELERREPQAIRFDENDDADVQQFWQSVDRDLHAGGSIDFDED